MTSIPVGSGRRPRVLVAGGGVAALEVLLALREHGPTSFHTTLLSPDDRFRYRPLSAYAGLAPDASRTVDLARFAAAAGAGLVCDRLATLDAEAQVARTAHGGAIAFDAMVLATGAIQGEGLPGAITLGAPGDETALAMLVERVRAGTVDRAAVVVPSGVAWSLPAYELALLLQHAAPDGRTAVVVVTREARPMEMAGREFSDAVTALLDRRGIAVTTSTAPDSFDEGRLWLPLEGAPEVDAVVALARPHGPSLPGLPCDDRGFVVVDARGRVPGLARVWAVGDVAAHPVKQGGFAVLQADVAAGDVADRLALTGHAPRPSVPPVLRAALLDGTGTLYLRTERVDGTLRTTVSDGPLWWPPTKIAGGRLPSWLAAFDAHGAGDAGGPAALLGAGGA
ncbi:FAD-dependent oxidoreductase [Patulibacter sp.]|uniref:FAD-dependent oxidoreductase n=1 Tax=Patulibacter sp. TaxID=1912859 RepID=UPI0027207B0B|nr:FAD-dependent oxidoreductase [Patulibacter sp.]MDO9410894.1 FAD-dependent oxidoreductase [Patulibacter sp.]